MEIAARPPSEKTKSIVKYGRYPSSIFDHMYDEPHRIALITIKAKALFALIMFIQFNLPHYYIILEHFAIFIANTA